MNKKNSSGKFRMAGVLLLFAMAFCIVGGVLRNRTRQLLQSYTESQTGKQAESFALLMAEKFDAELAKLEYIAGRLESSPGNMDALMMRDHDGSGVRQGLLGIDGKTLYGDRLKFAVFEGIQSSFRGNRAVTYMDGEGLLFTCPVFNGPNIRYVLYRLCPGESLQKRFATEIYEDLGKFCVTTRAGQIVVPFYNYVAEDMYWYESEDIRSKYMSMHMEMEVSVAAARKFDTTRGEMLLFEAEIPGTDFLVSGFVPMAVATEGIDNVTLLVLWVFGLLMLLVLIGGFYLVRIRLKIRESDELREAKAVAEEASRAKSDFLANMSHEIRTPINAVLGMNEMILRESGDDTITTYASNIRAAGNSLLGLINDILDFSKIEAGKIEIIPAEYDLSYMISDLVNMIQARVEEKGLELRLDFDPTLPKGLYGDEVRIKQVITNLLSNAVKYTEKGSVTLGIHYEESGEEDDRILLKVYVKDTGIGIRREDLEKLFIEFERIEEKRNRNIEGTGLGMSITKNLLEMMGSSLVVESVYGEGSVFSFELSQKVTDWDVLGDYRAAYRERLAAEKGYQEKFTAPDARVLVVDDNEMNLMVFKSLVKQTLVKIDTACSGDEGIALSEREKYDMIFLDHMMPVKDGIETLREIKADWANPNRETPAVCLTANAISGAREEYLAAGFDDYLSKPIDPGRLEEMMLAFLPKERIRIRMSTTSGGTAEDGGGSGPAGSSSREEFAVLAGSTIDTEEGIRNSGTRDAYRAVLKVFYNSEAEQSRELNALYGEKDIKNYTIKVHALKSSARIIGAKELGEEAQKLENAGKAGDEAYIRAHHEAFMEKYHSIKELLASVFPEEKADKGKAEADAEMMADVFAEIRAAADDMDCGRLESIFSEMEGYSIPQEQKELFGKVKAASDNYDYDKILELLDRN
ncbi:MAG: response regulator [Lachnospiraceae bacterium]|nr:response regulator [Lachnospiraceae bacterium]